QNVVAMLEVQATEGRIHDDRANSATGPIQAIDQREGNDLFRTRATNRNLVAVAIKNAEPIVRIDLQPSIALLGGHPHKGIIGQAADTRAKTVAQTLDTRRKGALQLTGHVHLDGALP